MISCSGCNQRIAKPEDLLAVETDAATRYFCKPCIKKAVGTMVMKIYLNKDDRAFLKKMKKFIKHEKN